MPGINQARNNKLKEGGKKFKYVQKDIQYASSSIGSMYATVKGACGNCRFEVETLNGEKKFATLCGSVKKGGKVITDNFVLIEPLGTNYQIIYKYNKNQKIQLENEGYLNKIVDPVIELEKQKKDKTHDIIFGTDTIENTINLIDNTFIENIMKRKET